MDNNFIIFSNLFYLLPIASILYEKILGNKNGIFTSYFSNSECIVLIISSLLVVITSSIYHNCDNIFIKYNELIDEIRRMRFRVKNNVEANKYTIADKNKLDKLKKEIDNLENEKGFIFNNRTKLCYNGYIKYENLKNLDHIFGYFIICLILIMITPIYGKYKNALQYIVLLFIMISINLEGSKLLFGGIGILLIPIIILELIFIIYVLTNLKKYSRTSIIIIVLAKLSFILGVSFQLMGNIDIGNEHYKILHSIWHIFTALAGTLLLLTRTKIVK